MLGLTPAYVLLSFCSLHQFYTQSAFYPWSAVCSLQSAVRSPQSTVHSLRLAPTDKKVNFEFGFKLQAQQIIMLL